MNISSNHLFVREIHSALSSVHIIEQLVQEVVLQFALCEDLNFKMQVALIEAVNNAIIHGNNEKIFKTVIITCVVLKDCFRFSIKDEGSGFNYNHLLSDPTQPKKIEEPNGRGLFLINHFCDQFTFIDRGRIIQMDFKHSL